MKNPKTQMKLSKIFEDLNNPTMKFYHGGNLDFKSDYIINKKGRYEYGVGLYLTTSLEVAEKYAKGSRKLYEVIVSDGTQIKDVEIPLEQVTDFIKQNVLTKKRNEILNVISKYISNGKINASRLNTIILNYQAVPTSKINSLKELLLNNGVDYLIDHNTFGWGETTLVLFNMKKIISYKQISLKDIAN